MGSSMWKMAGTLAVVCGIGPVAAAEVVFFDNFESYITNTSANNSQLNWNPPATSPWTVTDGTIDIIEDGNQWGLDASTGSGLLDGGDFFLDMDGSTGNAGVLMSIDLGAIGGVASGGPGPFTNLIDGQTYQLEFIMSGNQRSGSDTAEIGVVLGDNVLISQNLTSTSPWTIYSALFTYSTGDQLFFRNLGGDNIGVLLDNVRISVVPVPPAAALGFLGFGMVAWMRKRKTSIPSAC